MPWRLLKTQKSNPKPVILWSQMAPQNRQWRTYSGVLFDFSLCPVSQSGQSVIVAEKPDIAQSRHSLIN